MNSRSEGGSNSLDCPECGHGLARVKDSRPTTNLAGSRIGIRRRRECMNCGHRYTTAERLVDINTEFVTLESIDAMIEVMTDTLVRMRTIRALVETEKRAYPKVAP